MGQCTNMLSFQGVEVENEKREMEVRGVLAAHSRISKVWLPHYWSIPP